MSCVLLDTMNHRAKRRPTDDAVTCPAADGAGAAAMADDGAGARAAEVLLSALPAHPTSR